MILVMGSSVLLGGFELGDEASSGVKKSEAVLLVQDLKTMAKWTLVLTYGRLYITAYSKGGIIF